MAARVTVLFFQGDHQRNSKAFNIATQREGNSVFKERNEALLVGGC